MLQISAATDSIAVAVDKENHKEPPSSFLYFRADRKMVKVFFNDILFIIDKIESFNADNIQIAKHELPIGRLYKYDVIRLLNASSATD